MVGGCYAMLLAAALAAEPAAADTLPAPQRGPDLAAQAGATETLQEVWAAALACDERLAAMHAAARAAGQRIRASEGHYWPDVRLESRYAVLSDAPAYDFGTVLGLPGVAFPFAQREGLGFSLRVAQPLYTFGRIRHGVEAAEAVWGAAQHAVRRTELEVKLQAAAAFLGVLQAEADVVVARANVAALCAHEVEVSYHAELGASHRTALLGAQLACNEARQRLLAAEQALAAASAQLNRLLARPLDAPLTLAEPPPPPTELNESGLTALALQCRPELAELACRAAALRHQAAAVKAHALPQIGLVARHDYLENRFVDPQGISSAAVGADWSLFQGGQRYHQTAALQADAESLCRLRRDLERQIVLEVRLARLQCETSQRYVAVCQQAIAQAEEHYRVTAERFRDLLATHADVLDAEAARRQAYVDYHHARYDTHWAYIRLLAAAGQL
ncbi:MAG: TolC family protein [Pirellulales bacterium]|nr:TolC family protein [Pirellulales bacterium]